MEVFVKYVVLEGSTPICHLPSSWATVEVSEDFGERDLARAVQEQDDRCNADPHYIEIEHYTEHGT